MKTRTTPIPGGPAMTRKRILSLAMLVLTTAVINATARDLTPLEELGKFLFFDTNLSTPPGQACAACHAPEVGFTGPDSDINATLAVYHGAVHTRFGNRKPPTAAYGGDSPVLYYDEDEELWIGGMFWDGRATGWTLGDPLTEQAQGPFLNPVEQNNSNARHVCIKVDRSDYADLFEQVWGPGSLDPVMDVAGTYERIARSIAAYEKSPEVNPFSSKYDYFLAGMAELTAQEAWGLELFEGKAMCNACHISEPGSGGEPPLFTDFTYDNLGVPKNPVNPFYDMPRKWNIEDYEWVDPGLGGFLARTGYNDHAADNYGKHKVPTLRNVDKRSSPGFVKAFGHNGFFKSLEEIVHFYNTRDVEPWPAPEVPDNVNSDELGNLGLTADEEAAIVAFMTTLSDGYEPPAMARMAGIGSLGLSLPGPDRTNVSATIGYSLPQAANVQLDVYNLRGQRVATLVRGWHDAGAYRADMMMNRMASGVYLLRLSDGDTFVTRKLTVLK
jgi:cytochrome c peroxidase